MKKLVLICSSVFALSVVSSGAFAESDVNATSETKKMSEAKCTTLWSKATGGSTGDLAMDKATAYVKDFKKADTNSDSKLSASEWSEACAKGWVVSDAAGAGHEPIGQPGETSDRTPGKPDERAPGASSTGAAGTEAGKSPEGTSDRTPQN